MGRLVHTGLGEREQLCNWSCSNKTHTLREHTLRDKVTVPHSARNNYLPDERETRRACRCHGERRASEEKEEE